MTIQGCGVCMYGSNSKKYEDKQHVDCMLDGYTCHSITEKCNSFKRDYKKDIVIKYDPSKKR